MADQQSTGTSPATPTGPTSSTEDMQRRIADLEQQVRRIADLERQVRNLQVGMIHALGGADNDGGVVRLSDLHELADILWVSFNEHAAHIDNLRERVQTLEETTPDRPSRTQTGASAEQPSS